jgi:hypothetical protein
VRSSLTELAEGLPSRHARVLGVKARAARCAAIHAVLGWYFTNLVCVRTFLVSD